MFNFLTRSPWKKPKDEWRPIPFLSNTPYEVNRDGVVRDVRGKFILKPYPYNEEYGKELVAIGIGKFFCYINGPALADVLFDKPGGDAKQMNVFFTGYNQH